jgi:hypothetical protein
MNEPSQTTWRDVVIARLQDAMWGYNGTNGVVGQTKDHERRIEALEQYRRDLKTVQEVARWMVLGLAAVIGFLLTDPAAKIIAALASIK